MTDGSDSGIVSDNFTSVERYRKRCGKRIFIPRYGPRPIREGHNLHAFLRRNGYVALPTTPDDKIRKFSDYELTRFISSSDK